jgi:uncharacterized membrane protein
MSSREDPSGVEKTLGRVLRVGVTLSTWALAGGLAASLALGRGIIANSLLTFGILTLMATPFARVAVSTVLYVLRRDWAFVVLTLVVLGELIAGLVAAARSLG